MKQRDFSFLTKHFDFETFEITPEHRLTKQIFKKWEEWVLTESSKEDNIKYACAFKGMSSDTILFSYESSEPINSDAYLKGYYFYLKQLPSLNLSDVAMFFAFEWYNENLIEGIFKIEENYPSEFAAELLKETYGKVVFTNQFTTLLAACLPVKENSHKDREGYRRGFNMSATDKFKKMESMYLPDGVNLAEVLRKYTINKNNGIENYGFISHPTHKIAYDFITRAKKYL